MDMCAPTATGRCSGIYLEIHNNSQAKVLLKIQPDPMWHEKQQQLRKGSQRELFLWKRGTLQFCQEELAFSTKAPPYNCFIRNSF